MWTPDFFLNFGFSREPAAAVASWDFSIKNVAQKLYDSVNCLDEGIELQFVVWIPGGEKWNLWEDFWK